MGTVYKTCLSETLTSSQSTIRGNKRQGKTVKECCVNRRKMWAAEVGEGERCCHINTRLLFCHTPHALLREHQPQAARTCGGLAHEASEDVNFHREDGVLL